MGCLRSCDAHDVTLIMGWGGVGFYRSCDAHDVTLIMGWGGVGC